MSSALVQRFSTPWPRARRGHRCAFRAKPARERRKAKVLTWIALAVVDPTIDCRKSEIKLSLPDEQVCPFAQPKLGARVSAQTPPARKAPRKNFSAKIPRNPLISLDSDERIQGNPRKSNTRKGGFSQPNRQGPRKSKRRAAAALRTSQTGSASRAKRARLAPAFTPGNSAGRRGRR